MNNIDDDEAEEEEEEDSEDVDGSLGTSMMLLLLLSIEFVSSSLALNEAPFWYRTSSSAAVRLSISASLAGNVELSSANKRRLEN